MTQPVLDASPVHAVKSTTPDARSEQPPTNGKVIRSEADKQTENAPLPAEAPSNSFMRPSKLTESSHAADEDAEAPVLSHAHPQPEAQPHPAPPKRERRGPSVAQLAEQFVKLGAVGQPSPPFILTSPAALAAYSSRRSSAAGTPRASASPRHHYNTTTASEPTTPMPSSHVPSLASPRFHADAFRHHALATNSLHTNSLPSSPTAQQSPPLPTPTFSSAQPPQLVAPPSTCSAQLQWPPQQQTGTLEGRDSEDLPRCSVAYRLELREIPNKQGQRASEDWRAAYTGKDCRAEVCDLRPGRRYALRVVLLPEVPAGVYCQPPPPPPSESLLIDTLPTPPMQPPLARLAGRARSWLKLKWVEPEECGGRPVIRYRALVIITPPDATGQPPAAASDSSQDWAPLCDGEVNSSKLSGLKPATRVDVKYQVFNELGSSPWSEVASFTTAASVPDPVPNLTVGDATHSTLDVHWDEAACNGEEVTGYRLEIDDGNGGAFDLAWHGIQCGHEVVGLTSGRMYRFRVCAINRVGKGQMSPIVQGRTAAQAPPAPESLRVLGTTHTTATLEWQPPPFDGGSPVTGWTVQVQPKTKAGQTHRLSADWTILYEGERAACTLKGLRSGCAYRARAFASSSVGRGRPGIPIDVMMAADAPQPPLHLVTLDKSRHSLTVTWEPPDFDGGSAVVSYRLEVCRAPSDADAAAQHDDTTTASSVGWATAATTSEMSCDVADLQPGTTYCLRAFAINALGSSPPSEPHRDTTVAAPPGPPGAPTLDASAASTSLQLRWAWPEEYGAPVASFTLQILQQDTETQADSAAWQTVYEGRVPCAKVRQLRPATCYVARVRATSSVGNGDWSVVKLNKTAASVPSAPTSVSATAAAENIGKGSSRSASSGRLTLRWQPPLRDNGTPVSGFAAQICQLASRSRSDASWRQVYSGVELSCLVEGLAPGKAHAVRVRASNVHGFSSWSDTAFADTAPGPPSRPAPPTFSQVTAVSMRARWSPPSHDNGAAVVGYRLESRAEGENKWCQLYSGVDVTCKVSSLQPGTIYQIRVTAWNAQGESEPSEWADVRTPQPPPPPPLDLSAAPSCGPDGHAIELTWQPRTASDAGGDSFAGCASYEAEAAAAGKQTQRLTCPARMDSCTLPDLSPGTDYKVRIRAVGVAGTGHGPWSEATHVKTPPDTVSVPAASKQPAVPDGVGPAVSATSDRGPERDTPQRRAKRGVAKAVSTAKARPAASGPGWSPRRLQKELRRHGLLLVAIAAVIVIAALAALWDPAAFGGNPGSRQY